MQKFQRKVLCCVLNMVLGFLLVSNSTLSYSAFFKGFFGKEKKVVQCSRQCLQGYKLLLGGVALATIFTTIFFIKKYFSSKSDDSDSRSGSPAKKQRKAGSVSYTQVVKDSQEILRKSQGAFREGEECVKNVAMEILKIQEGGKRKMREIEELDKEYERFKCREKARRLKMRNISNKDEGIVEIIPNDTNEPIRVKVVLLQKESDYFKEKINNGEYVVEENYDRDILDLFWLDLVLKIYEHEEKCDDCLVSQGQVQNYIKTNYEQETIGRLFAMASFFKAFDVADVLKLVYKTEEGEREFDASQRTEIDLEACRRDKTKMKKGFFRRKF